MVLRVFIGAVSRSKLSSVDPRCGIFLAITVVSILTVIAIIERNEGISFDYNGFINF